MGSVALRLGRQAQRSVVAFLAQFAEWCWNDGRTAHRVFILGGWALLTYGVASLTVPEVWPISGGLFCLSFAGWGHLRVLFTMGWWALNHPPADR